MNALDLKELKVKVHPNMPISII